MPKSLQPWAGCFSSSSSPLIKGIFFLSLDDIDETDYDTSIELYFTGVYNHGVVLTGSLRISNDKMIMSWGSYPLIFNIRSKIHSKIKGTYSGSDDEGVFEMIPGNKSPNGETIESSCVII